MRGQDKACESVGRITTTHTDVEIRYKVEQKRDALSRLLPLKLYLQ